MLSAHERDSAGRDRLLLTVTFPIKETPAAAFHAAMLSFPEGSVQQVLTDSPERLGEATDRMKENGCPKVVIEPVETVGYYQLGTETPSHC